MVKPQYNLNRIKNKLGKDAPEMPAQKLLDALNNFRGAVKPGDRDKGSERKLEQAIRERMKPGSLAMREKPIDENTPSSVLLKLEARYERQQQKAKTYEFHPWLPTDGQYLLKVKRLLKKRGKKSSTPAVLKRRLKKAGTRGNSRPNIDINTPRATLTALRNELRAQRLADPGTFGSDEQTYLRRVDGIFKRLERKAAMARKQANTATGNNPFALRNWLDQPLKKNLNVKGAQGQPNGRSVRNTTAVQRAVDSEDALEVVTIRKGMKSRNIATFARNNKVSLATLKKLNPKLDINEDDEAGPQGVQFKYGTKVTIPLQTSSTAGVTTGRAFAKRRRSGGQRTLFKQAMDKGYAEQQKLPLPEYTEPLRRPATQYGMTPSQINRIETIVYGTDSEPSLPMGMMSIYNIMKAQGNQPTQESIKLWLRDQELTQVYQQRMKKGHDVSPFTPVKPLVAISVDLFTVTNQVNTAANKEKRRGGVVPQYWKSFGRKGFVLLVLDNYSRMLWARALPDKTPAVVARAMSEILEEDLRPILKKLNRRIEYCQSDFGPEFRGEFSDMMEQFVQVKGSRKKGIRQIYTKGGEPQANGLVERSVGLVRRLLMKAYTIKGGSKGGWRGLLPGVIAAYNNHYNESIRRSPKEAFAQDKADEFEELRSDVRESQVKRRTEPEKDFPLHALVRLRIGDNDGFNKSSKQTYYKSIYQVDGKHRRNKLSTTQYTLGRPAAPYLKGTTQETKDIVEAQVDGRGGSTTKLLSKTYPRNLLLLVTNVQGANKLAKGPFLRTG